jgi:PIN domain nuclease of toxin-antitoxin system
MRFLLDTHTVIWYLGNLPKLPTRTKQVIDNDENNLYISSISLWEIAIKVSLDKLELHFTFEEFLDEVKNSTFNLLQIGDEHLRKSMTLPFLHKDPFDRLLVSTALAENLTMITADENIHKYDVPWIW